MKKYIYIVLYGFIFNLVFNSCKNPYNQIIFKENSFAEVHVLSNSPQILSSLQLLKYKNYLLISEYKGDSLLWIYDLTQSRKNRKILPKGLGEDNFQSPIYIQIKDSMFFINNRWHNSAGDFFIDLNLLQVRTSSRFSVHQDIDMLYSLNDSLYIASGRFQAGRYAILTSLGIILNFFGTYPNYQQGEDRIPNFPKFMFHQTRFSKNESLKLLISCSSHVLDIHNILNPFDIKLKQRILLSTYKYRYQEGDGWASSERMPGIETGAIDVCSSNKYIYILYSPTKKTKSQKKY